MPRSKQLLPTIGLLLLLASMAGTPTTVGARRSSYPAAAARDPASAVIWHEVQPLPQPSGGLAAATDSGYLFINGGYNGAYQWASYSTQSLANGGLKNWHHTTSLPVPLYSHAMAAALGSLYVIGGTTNGRDTGAQNIVYRTRLLPGGKTGNWARAGKLPARVYGHGATARDGYLYVAGGYVLDQGYSNAVYSIKLTAHGFAGSWRTLPSLPQPRFGATLVARPGYLFAVGGMSQGTVADTVYVAAIQKGGTIGAWHAVRPLPHALARVGAAIVGSYLVIAGGTTGLNLINPVATVYAARILPGGKLAPWTPQTSLHSPAAAPVLLMVGKYLYLLGGFTGKVYDSSIQQTCAPFFPACAPTPSKTAAKKGAKP